jgi:hypothetical protein
VSFKCGIVTGWILFALAAAAEAQTTIQSFKWGANARFTLSMRYPRASNDFKGELRSQSTATATFGSLTATLKNRDAFVTVILTQKDRPTGHLFILESQNSTFEVLNETPIPGDSATMIENLDAALDGLKQTNGWDASQSFRKILEHFTLNPQQRLEDFSSYVKTLVEGGQRAPVARPTNRLEMVRDQGGVGPLVLPSARPPTPAPRQGVRSNIPLPVERPPLGPPDDDQLEDEPAPDQAPPPSRRTPPPLPPPRQVRPQVPGSTFERPTYRGPSRPAPEAGMPEDDEAAGNQESVAPGRIRGQRRWNQVTDPPLRPPGNIPYQGNPFFPRNGFQ